MESLAVSSSAALVKSPLSCPLSSSLSSSARCSFRRLLVSPNKHKVHATMTTNLQSPTAGKVITCKAAVSWKAKEPLVIEEIQVAPPMPGEVRIKILYTSLCHTDVTFWLDKSNLGMFPRIFGHEAAGIVESVGEGVTDLKVGDHVLPIFTGECKNCIHCRSVKSNICETLRIDVTRGVMLHDKKSRFSIKGKPIHFFLGSTFSQYTVVESGSVVKVDPEAPLDKICILSCGVTTGMGSVFKAAKMESGSTVAVFGLGTIGLAAAEAARIGGASRIIGVDTNSDRFERARKFGCTEFVNPKDHSKPVEEVIRAMTNGGVDYSFECVGNAKVCESALLCCHDGWGLCVITGVEGHANNNAALHPGVFLYGRTLTGAFFGGLKPKSELPQFVDRYMRKEYEVEKFITHTLPFTEINEAIRLMMDGESLRCVMDLNL